MKLGDIRFNLHAVASREFFLPVRIAGGSF
jgi:hypothetical protein